MGVDSSRIRELAVLADQVPGVHKLYFGESNIPTPDFIKKAAQEAIAQSYTFYTPNAGYLELRQAISEKVMELQGLHHDPETEIIVTGSGVTALLLSIFTVLGRGEKAIILSPAWPNSKSIVQMVGGIPLEIPLREGRERYEVDLEQVGEAMDDSTRLLILSSPSNPLGWVASEEEQRALAELAQARGVTILSDEVYERIVYDRPVASSIAQVAPKRDGVIIAHSFSKSYCMTGWRVGYCLASPEVIGQMVKLQEFVVSHPSSVSQRAGIVALREGEGFVKEMVGRYRRQRDYTYGRLSQMKGLEVKRPEGAFYIFPRVDGLRDSFAFARELLLKKAVGVAPGCAFGIGGEGCIRICFAAEHEVIAPALDRIEEFLSERQIP
jgi:aspartate/methionine/tyrosine aminotransferase